MAVPKSLYYGGVILLSVVLTMQGVRFNWRGLIFLFIALFSVVVNDIDPVFRAEERLASFVLLMLVVGPVNETPATILYRRKLFKYLTYTLVAFSSLSFLLFFTRVDIFFHHNGLFKGLFSHSMVLGPLAGISSLCCLQRVLSLSSSRSRYVWMALLLASIFSCLLSGSRIALLGSFVGMGVMVYIIHRDRFLRFAKIVLSIIVLLTLTQPLWYDYTKNIRMKMAAQETTFGTRGAMWQDRLLEFQESPFLGSGFASIDLTVVSAEVNESGGVEPGTSWLFLLSSMGGLGMLGFFILLYPARAVLRRSKIPDRLNIVLISILSFFAVHMIAEGYILASGSILCVYLWLTLGLLQPYPQRQGGLNLLTIDTL